MSRITDFNKELSQSLKLIADFTKSLNDLIVSSEKVKKSLPNLDNSAKSAKNSGDELQKLKTKQEELTNSSAQLIAIEKQKVTTLNAINREQAKITQLNSEESKQLRALSETRKEQVKLLDSQENSLKRLKAENSKLIAQRDKINVSTKAGQKEIQRLNAVIDKNTKVIKQNSSAHEKQRANIGNYTQGVGELGTAFGGPMVSGIQRGLKAFKTFATFLLTNPIGLIISAIVLAVVALKQAFTASEEGQNKWAKIMRVIGVVVENLLDLLADLGEKIIKTFENPREALNNFAEALKKNITNRVEGIIKLIPRMGEAISLVFKGEFKEAGKVAFDAVAQVGTGVENVSDKIVKGFEKAKTATQEFITEQEREIAIAKRLADLQAETDKLERKQIVNRARLESEIADMRLKSRQEDQFSATERLAFLNRANELQEELLLTDQKIANNKLEIVRVNNTLARSNKENLDAEAKAQAEVFKIESARANQARQIERERIRVSRQVQAEIEKERKEIEAMFESMEELGDSYLGDGSFEQDLLEIGDTTADVFNRVKEQLEDLDVKILDPEKEKEQIQQFLDDLQKLEEEGLISSEDARIARSNAIADNLKEGVAEFTDFSLQVTTGAQEAFSNILSVQLDSLETKRNKELKAAGNDAKKREEINKRYAEKEKEIRKKAADVEFAINTAQILALTAKAITEAAPNPVLQALAAFVGATQLAAAVAQRNKVKSLADGEVMIDGPGTERSDSIPAMLSKNESVINAKATKASYRTLSAINEGRITDNDLVPVLGGSFDNSILRSIDKRLAAQKYAYVTRSGKIIEKTQDGRKTIIIE